MICSLEIGEIHIVCGPMFVGKSSELRRRANCATWAGNTVLVVSNPLDAARAGSGHVLTHDGHKLPCQHVADLDTVRFANEQFYSTILVDECQFFDVNQLVRFSQHAIQHCTQLVLFGLDGQYNLKPFKWVGKMLPYARSIVKLTGQCKGCPERSASICSVRIEEPNWPATVADSEESVVVGGDDKYKGSCLNCHPGLVRDRHSSNKVPF
jgi:thymidine kinase